MPEGSTCTAWWKAEVEGWAIRGPLVCVLVGVLVGMMLMRSALASGGATTSTLASGTKIVSGMKNVEWPEAIRKSYGRSGDTAGEALYNNADGSLVVSE